MKLNILGSLMVLLVLLAGCKRFEGDCTTPAYIHLDRLVVVDNEVSLSSEEGFFTSLIDAVQIELWFDGEENTTQIGTFQLPCEVPVLSTKPIKKMHIYPFVKQNGLSGTRIYYPYYDYVVLENVPLVADNVTPIGTADSNSGYTLAVHYSERMQLLASEFFEPASAAIIFDTNVKSKKYDGNACSGYGYGEVTLQPDQQSREFRIKNDFKVTDPTKVLYLELDIKNNVRLAVQMRSAYTRGSNPTTQDIMTVYEHADWKKMYINLGRTWADFSHNPDFSIHFTALNPEGIDGSVCLDNVKIVSL